MACFQETKITRKTALEVREKPKVKEICIVNGFHSFFDFHPTKVSGLFPLPLANSTSDLLVISLLFPLNLLRATAELSLIFVNLYAVQTSRKLASLVLYFPFKSAPTLDTALDRILKGARKRWMKSCSRAWMLKVDQS